MSTGQEHEIAGALAGLRVAFVGKLGGVTKREAHQLARDHGGIPVEAARSDANLIVVGADELPINVPDDLLDDGLRRAAGEGRVEIISETQFWQRLGLVEGEQNVRRLYTPAMLAELLRVPIATVRRWHRRGLIAPVREVKRLPYFDFQEVATARQLAELLAAGVSPTAIEKKLAELARYVPEAERPLAQLSVIVEGKQLLLRHDEGLIDPTGQRRIDFDSIERLAERYFGDENDVVDTLPFEERRPPQPESGDPLEMIEFAATLEDTGRLEEAAEWYRTAMAAAGPRAEICFQLAELLYRIGDASAARERYYMAIELDEDFVEARANLGCVLAETGQLDLAVAAFQGALAYHRDFPDVHYHLARALDDLDRLEQADEHWREFLSLAPESPWADEARDRLGIIE